jgi:4-azaleucine resistance transporter AzlC
VNSRKSEFIKGAKDTIPMLVGATPFAIIFGGLAVASGLSKAGTMAMSIFVFAGASQFIALALIAKNTALVVILLTTLIVNFRHILYSLTLLPKLKHLSQPWKAMLAFGLTDESFAVATQRLSIKEDSYLKWYLLGSTTSMYLNWVAWTFVGLLAGQTFPNLDQYGFDFAMIATFVGIVIPLVKNFPYLLALTSAGVSSIIFYNMPYKTGLLVAAFIGISSGVISEKLNQKSTKAQNDE